MARKCINKKLLNLINLCYNIKVMNKIDVQETNSIIKSFESLLKLLKDVNCNEIIKTITLLKLLDFLIMKM